MSNLPEPYRRPPHPVHPGLLKAAVSPTAVAVTAAGAGIGLLDHSILLTVILAACGWTGRMVAAAFALRRRERAARPRPAELDPWSVPEPWRQLLQQASDAQSRFDQAVAAWPPGPTRDRLATLQPRIYEEVARLGVTARQGAAAGGWNGAIYGAGRPSPESLGEELKRVQADRARLVDKAPGRDAELARREEAVAAQLRAARRAVQVSDELQDRLRRAVARLDETVSELMVVEASPATVEPVGVTSALDELRDGVTSLREALTEASGAPPEPRTP